MSERSPKHTRKSEAAVADGATRENDIRRRSHSNIGKYGLVAVAAGVSLGAFAGCNNDRDMTTTTNEVEVSPNEKVTVGYIDRELSEQHVIGFGTTVRGASAEQVIEREGLFGIDLPSLKNSISIDEFYTVNSFCYDGGTEQIKEITYRKEGEEERRHYEVTIDPEDVRVCSKKDPSATSIPKPGANWVENINNMSNDLDRLLKQNLNLPISEQRILEENKLKAELTQTAENAALLTGITACGPEVFKETKDDIAELIVEDVVRSDNETAEVIFDIENGEEIELSKESDIRKALKEKRAAGWNIELGEAAECEIPEGLKGAQDDRI